MSVSKSRKVNRLMFVLVAGFVGYMVFMFFFLGRMDPTKSLDEYQKTSVDNTPLFELTEPHTKCRYVYDSVNKSIKTAIGSEQCELPALN